MDTSKPSILVISSVTYASGVLGVNYYDALKDEGYDVDFLTRDYHPDRPEFIHVLNKGERAHCLMEGIRRRTERFLFPKHKLRFSKNGYCFFYRKETHPPVDSYKVIKKISRKYDLVIVFFWQELLSYQTIKEIDKKLGGVSWIFIAPDYSPITGGCHFMYNCKGYQNECGSCPAWKSNNPNDFTHYNWKYRNQVLNNLNVTLCSNSFVVDNFFSKSSLFKNRRIEKTTMIIDENKFYPKDKIAIRKKLHLPVDKFVVLFGSQNINDSKKGINYLFKALMVWYKSLTKEQQEKILIVSVGSSDQKIKDKIPFDYSEWGYVDLKTLSDLYVAANVFACPSVFDPGPMMVNQAISCGTPVVAFNNGTILDVKNYGNAGYVALLENAEDFAHGLNTIFCMTKEEQKQLSLECRDIAMRMTSRKSCVKSIMAIYSKMNSIPQNT